MSAIEVTSISLLGGVSLMRVTKENADGAPVILGHLALESDGRLRVWEQTWHDSFRPTPTVFPGAVSALRAILTGAA